ncbi:MAG: hypothetical protein ABUL42_00370 [Terricaulis silvestris]
MAEAGWNFDDLDAETQARIEAEAAEHGMDPADYLADILLASLLTEEQHSEVVADEPEPFLAPVVHSQREAALKPRIEALERRFDGALRGLEGAVGAVDASLVDVASRLDERDELDGKTAEALAELRAAVDALDAGLTDAGAAIETLRGEAFAFNGQLSKRVSLVEREAEIAEHRAAELASAHEDLKRALATDFCAYVDATDERLSRQEDDMHAGIDGVREAFKAHADASGARMARHEADARAAQDRLKAALTEELRASAETVAQRLAHHERESRMAREELKHTLTEDLGSYVQSLDERLTKQSLEFSTQIEIVSHDAEKATAEALEEIRAARDTLERRLDDNVLHIRTVFDESTRRTQAGFNLISDRCDGLARELDEHRDAITALNEDVRAEFSQHQARALAASQATQAEIARSTQALRAEAVEHAEALAAQLTRLQGADRNLRNEQEQLETNIKAEIAEMRDRVLGAVARVTLGESEIIELSNTVDTLTEAIERVRDESEAEFSERFDIAALATADRLQALGQRLETHERNSLGVRQAIGENITRVEGQLRAAIDDIARAQQNDIARIDGTIQNCAHESLAATRQLGADMTAAFADAETQNRGVLARLKMLDEALSVQHEAFAAADGKLARRLDQAEADITSANERAREGLQAMERRLVQCEAAAQNDASERFAARLDELRTRISAYERNAAELTQRVSERSNQVDLALADLRLDLHAMPPANADFNALFAGVQRRLDGLEQKRDFGAEARSQIEARLLAVETKSVRMLEQLSETIALLSQKAPSSDKSEPSALSA